jgi:DtxR family Mn-dependent transcriptional regulator
MTDSHSRTASRTEQRRGGVPPSEAIEDYAKAIYTLAARAAGPVATSELAGRLGVAPSSVTAMLKRLDAMGLARYVPYRGVQLTSDGERLALEVLRHHRLIETFLAEALGMPWDLVHHEAEVLEHYISEEMERRIAERLGDPLFDPHGDPIPTAELSVAADRTRPLSELGPGDGGTFARVSDSEPEMLRHLDELGIAPGAWLEVIEVQPFGGPVIVRTHGATHALGPELARRMRVGEEGP